MNAPVLEETICRKCLHKWMAFYPDGKATGNAAECPNCRSIEGHPTDNEAGKGKA